MFSDYLRRGSATNKLFSILFSIVLVIGLMPVTAWGTEGETLDQQEAQTASTQATSTSSTDVESSDINAAVGGEVEQNDDGAQSTDTEPSASQPESTEAATEAVASAIAPMSEEGEGGIVTQAGDITIEHVYIYDTPTPTGTPLYDLTVDPDINMTAHGYGKQYWVQVVCSKDAGADAWVGLDIPYWMSVNSTEGDTYPAVGPMNTTNFDSILSFTPATGASLASWVPGSPGKVQYHVKSSSISPVLTFAVVPNWAYCNGDVVNGERVTAQKLTASAGLMDDLTTPSSEVSTNSITKEYPWGGVLTGSTLHAAVKTNELGTAFSVTTGVASQQYCQVWTSIEFDLVIPDSATLGTVDTFGTTPTPVGAPVDNHDGTHTQHYSISAPQGSVGKNVSIQASFPAEGTYNIDMINMKTKAYDDETDFETYNAGPYHYVYEVSDKIGVFLNPLPTTPYDWNAVGVDTSMCLGKAQLEANGSRLLASDPYTIHTEFPTNAAISAVTIPKGTGNSDSIVVNGTTYSLASVAYQTEPTYFVLRAEDLGVAKIESYTYDMGSLQGGYFTYHPVNNMTSYPNNQLAWYGEFTNGTQVDVPISVYPTADPTNTIDITASSTPGNPPIAAISQGTVSQATLMAGSTQHISANYLPDAFETLANSWYDYEPAVYYFLPEEFTGVANPTINGTPVTLQDITASATGVPAGMRIYKADTPAGTEAGYYGPDGTQKEMQIEFDLLTEKSAPTKQYLLKDIVQVGNGDIRFGDRGAIWNPDDKVNTFDKEADIYSINNGDTLASPFGSFAISELKEVTVTNTMTVTSHGTPLNEPLTYNAGDPNGTRGYLENGFTADYKVHIQNQTGDNAENLEVFIPVAKAGQNFGTGFNPEGPQEFSLVLTKDTVPAGWTVEYIKDLTGTWTPGTCPASTDYSAATGPDDATMIRIVGPTTLADKTGADFTFKVTGVGTPPSGAQDVWNCIPHYKLAGMASEFIPNGSPEALEIAQGALSGTVYKDANGNGVMDASETPIGGVTVTATDNFTSNGTDYPRILTTTTNTNGEYSFTFLRNTAAEGLRNDGIELTVTVTNPDSSTYKFSPTTTTGTKPSVVSTTDDDRTASKDGITLTSTTPAEIDAGLTPHYTVTYKTDGNGTIGGAKTDITETVDAGKNPAHVPATVGDTGYVPDGWTANKDVTLKDGTTITAGSKITDAQVSNIVVTSDLTLTAKFLEQNGSVVKTLKSLTKDGAIGGTAVYEVTVTNNGTSELNGYKVVESPTGLTITGVTGTDTAWDAGTKTITFNKVAANGGTKTATVTCTITAAPFKNGVEPEIKNGDYTIAKTRVTDKTGATEATNEVFNGDTVFYKLELTNGATAIGTAGINITDTATNLSGGKYAADDSAFNGTWNTGQVAANAKASVVVKYTVDDTCTTITNAISAPNGTNDIVTTPVNTAKKDVTFTKVLDAAPPIAQGDTVTYTITATNNSTVDLTDVKATEAPTGLTITNVTGTGVTWADPTITFASIAAGDKATATVTATVDANEFSNGVTNPIPPDPKKSFVLDKIRTDKDGNAATGKVYVGDTVYYKLSIENTGTEDIAAGKVVADKFDGLTYVGTEGTVTGTVADDGSTWTAPAVAKGATASVILKFTVDFDSELITNTATCEGQTKVVTTIVEPSQKDVTFTKVLDTAPPIAQGDTVTYTITATNNSTVDLTDVKATEAPTGLTITNVTGTGVTWADPTITFASIAAGDKATATVTATVDANEFSNGVTNPIPPDPTKSFVLDKIRTDKDGNAATGKVYVGDTVYYKLSIENTGTEDIAAGKVVADKFDGLTYVGTEGTVTGTVADDGSTWTAPAVAKGATASVILKFTVDFDSELITNTATCEGQTKVVTTIVEPSQKDVTLDKTMTTTGVINVGDTISYDIDVINSGTVTLSNVKVDENPEGLSDITIVSPTTGVAYTNNQIILDELPAGTTTVKITAKVTSEKFRNGVANPIVDPKNDVSINKERVNEDGSALPADSKLVVGQTAYYKLTVTNTGEADIAAGKEVTDVAQGMVFDSVVSSDGTVSTDGGTWTLPALAKGASATAIIAYTVDDDATQATNRASVDGKTITVSEIVYPDYSLVKSTKKLLNEGTIRYGDEVSYEITVTNTGERDLTDVVVRENSTGLENVTMTPVAGATWSDADSTITIDALTVGQKMTFSITATVAATSFSNGVAIDNPNPPLNTPDPVLSKQRVTDMTGTTQATDVPIHGGTVYYKLTLANNGDKATDPMVVEDEFANMVWADQTQGDGTITGLTDSGFSWNVPAVDADDSVAIVYAMTVNQDADSITNSAVAEGLTPVVVTDLVNSGSAIVVNKTADNATPKPGDNITYTITVTNNGTGTSNTVWVKDYVPDNTTFVSCDATGTFGSSNGKNYVNWYPTAIPGGKTVTLTMTVKVNDGVAAGTAINNTALWEETNGEIDPTIDPIGGYSNSASSKVASAVQALSAAKSAKTGDNALPFTLALGGIIAAGCVAFMARRRRDDSK